MHQVVVSDWQNFCRNLSDVNICFQRRNSEADCSILLLCRVQKWNDIFKDAEYLGCLSTGRMYRNVEHIYGIWHESRCITVRKLANDLGSLLVYAVRFWHQFEFVIDCVKITALYVDRWSETIRIASVHTRTHRRNVGHSHFLSEATTGDNMGSPCLK